MSVPPESIKVRRCYLTDAGLVVRVQKITREGDVTYQHRSTRWKEKEWTPGTTRLRTLAFIIAREVPCDWKLEMDGSLNVTIPPESIEVGKCYLADIQGAPQVWRVVTTRPDGWLEYQNRSAAPAKRQVWRKAMTTVRQFAEAVSREVPCDWKPEMDGA